MNLVLNHILETKPDIQLILLPFSPAGPRVPETRRKRSLTSDFHQPHYAFGCVLIKNGRELEFTLHLYS